MFCATCGKELKDDAKFCGFCGNPIKLNAVEESSSEPVTTAVPDAPATVPASPGKPIAAPAPSPDPAVPSEAVDVRPAKEEATMDAAGFQAAGSGANPFASIASKVKGATSATAGPASNGSSFSAALNSRMASMNDGVESKAFSGSYKKTAESEDIAQKAKRAAEERAARRASVKSKAEERRGKKPVIAGFSDEEETSGPEHAVFAEGLPDWDLLPLTPFMVDRKAG